MSVVNKIILYVFKNNVLKGKNVEKNTNELVRKLSNVYECEGTGVIMNNPTFPKILNILKVNMELLRFYRYIFVIIYFQVI